MSPSARRVWIEICIRSKTRFHVSSPSSRRAWIEIACRFRPLLPANVVLSMENADKNMFSRALRSAKRVFSPCRSPKLRPDHQVHSLLLFEEGCVLFLTKNRRCVNLFFNIAFGRYFRILTGTDRTGRRAAPDGEKTSSGSRAASHGTYGLYLPLQENSQGKRPQPASYHHQPAHCPGHGCPPFDKTK